MQFFRTVFPNPAARYPSTLLTAEQATKAIGVIDCFPKSIQDPVKNGIEILATDPQAFKPAKKEFDAAVAAARNEVYLNKSTDAFERLALHKSLMVAGYYAKATDAFASAHDPHRFVQMQYNADVRRDLVIGEDVKKSFYGDVATKRTDSLVEELLETERFLFTDNRLWLVNGSRRLVCNIVLEAERIPITVPDGAELERLFNVEPVKKAGNFQLADEEGSASVLGPGWNLTDQYTDGYLDKGVTLGGVQAKDGSPDRLAVHNRQRRKVLSCRPESFAAFSPFGEARKITTAKPVFSVRYTIPPPPLTFFERVEAALLQAWVFVVAGWVMFWIVDEELLTLIGVFLARYEQKKILQQQAAEAQEPRIYIAKAKHHFHRWTVFS